MLTEEVNSLKHQLTMARNELNKLRQQIRNLQHRHKKDVEKIVGVLSNYRCEGCQRVVRGETQEMKAQDQNPPEKMMMSLALAASISPLNPPQHEPNPDEGQQQHPENGRNAQQISNGEIFRIIGVIRSCFPEKRAVPRQSTIGHRLKATLQLHPEVFTNPSHALAGLEDYSHLWIVYHFHRNTRRNHESTKAKVAPPRLNGQRIGVFATRSPHRPSPIGLSLVEIDRIEGSTISFFGTDMVDGTPVLDIKPYIPIYDTPSTLSSSNETGKNPNEMDRNNSFDGCENIVDFYGLRQEPDGEESDLEIRSTATNNTTNTTTTLTDLSTNPGFEIRVPAWIQMDSSVANTRLLSVEFSERAERQLEHLPSTFSKQCIIDILKADPRSVYLRTKYNTQIFTFQLSESTVTCKFDDRRALVTVVGIRPTLEHSTNDDASLHHHHHENGVVEHLPDHYENGVVEHLPGDNDDGSSTNE